MRVSVLGLGAGGHSRIGLRSDAGESGAVELVRFALDNGINFIDTAEAYGTEEPIGKALDRQSARNVVISSKLSHRKDDKVKTPLQIEASVDASLKRLRRDTIEIYHVHGISPAQYETAKNDVYPVLENMRRKGKIRYIGITEHFGSDPAHAMLTRAVNDGIWDVIMIGFNVLNTSARPVLEKAKEKNIGTLDMFAVRKALKDDESMRRYLSSMAADAIIDADKLKSGNPFDKLLESGECESVPEAAYRFCMHEPNLDVVLSGTGSIEHLTANIKAAESPPLPEAAIRGFEELFGSVDSVTGG